MVSEVQWTDRQLSDMVDRMITYEL